MLSQNLFVDVSKRLKVNYLRNEHRLWAYNEQKNSCKFPLLCVYFLLLPQSTFTVTVSHHLASFNLFFICRQDKDSKDEAAKAEKELQEIRKVIEKSGGKLSNRVLQSDVRKQG